MILLALGIIIGIFLTFIAVVFGTEKDKEIKQVLKKLGEVIAPPEKAEFLFPRESAAEAIAEVMKKNDEQGEDTEIKEL